MSESPNPTKFTLIGCIALLLWSSTIPFAKRVSEDLGALTSIALPFLISATLGIIVLSVTGKLKNREYFYNWQFYARVIFFVTNVSLFYIAVGNVERQGVPLVTLINYLWPTSTLLLSIWILKQHYRGGYLALGTILILSGLSIEILGPHTEDVFQAIKNPKNILSFVLVFMSGSVWALYAVLNRKWGMKAGGVNALPFVLLSASACIFIIRNLTGEHSVMTPEIVYPFMYLCAIPIIANTCWDLGTRYGNITLLSLLGDAMPWGSLTVTALYLQIPIGVTTWVSAVIIVLGALISRYSLLAASREN